MNEEGREGESGRAKAMDPGGWRSDLLKLVLRVVLVLGGLIYGPSVAAAVHFGFPGVVVVDTVAMALIVYLALFSARRSFRLRAGLLAAVMYVLGAWLMMSVGSISQIYLLAFSLLATLLLGLRVGLWTVGLNVLTMLVIGYVGFASPEMTPNGEEGFASWVVITLNFLLINLLLTLALGSVIGVLEAALEGAVATRLKLEAEQKELLIAHGQLVTREESQRKLEAQLRQAQKMDAVGRLAGGVAHDFNNMLSVILGNAQLTLKDLAADDPHRADLEQIIEAGKRSSGLTNQLLAFARQQTIAPEVIDLNETIANMLKMLRRLIGEDVELVFRPLRGLGRVKVDPTQIDQILANLAVNARDAIASVGSLLIETRAAALDADFVTAHPGAEPGNFILLVVSDNGVGMDAETLSRIFEPFFTTKPVGQGTGLGLATVYGIVKQNRGFITVASEPGQGTTFNIYLPRSDERPRRPSRPELGSQPPRGTETVLLVEDEVALLRLVQRLLERLGYRVLAAAGPQAALELSTENETIDLLITDVIMPQMSGREVREALRVTRPELKCLFLSGYTADVIAHRGVLESDVQFLQKPFTLDQLAHKVRLVLDEALEP